MENSVAAWKIHTVGKQSNILWLYFGEWLQHIYVKLPSVIIQHNTCVWQEKITYQSCQNRNGLLFLFAASPSPLLESNRGWKWTPPSACGVDPPK